MMLNAKKRKKIIAAFFTVLLLVQDFYPTAAYALTSGPAQPEMQKFQPAGASDMVDLFSGDFKYDIPLMDVGGYPLNLSYHSGTGIEDEASWVGTGWSLNPGSVTRTMRGLPDDFTGDGSASDPQDAVKTLQYQKPYKKIGAQLTLKTTALGWDWGSASLHLDIHKDNYWGIGASVGAGVNFNLDISSATSLTAGLSLNSDNRDGVTVSPNINLTASYDDTKENNGGSLSGGFSYNTRSGLENVNLGLSYNTAGQTEDDYGNATGKYSGGLGFASFDKYYSHTYTPTRTTNTTHSQGTFSIDIGPALFGGYVGAGGSGYVFSQQTIDPNAVVPAYGYMHYSAGVKNPSALLDFNRERDGVFNTYQPAIPVPVSTPDYFVATSQAGMQQFRPVYNGNYVVYDRQYSDKSNTTALGLTVGAGNIFQAGARLNLTSSQNVTREWTTNNQYLSSLNPSGVTYGPQHEDVYFKQAGEQTRMSSDFYNAIGKDDTRKVMTSVQTANGPTALGLLVSANGQQFSVGPMTRQYRDVRTSTMTALTAQQASVYGLDKKIIDGTNAINRVDDPSVVDPTSSDPDFKWIHKPHHLSELTVTDKSGKRMVYGIPVYNYDQEEVSFSVAYPGTLPDGSSDFATDRRTGQFQYVTNASNPTHGDNTAGNNKGRQNIYNRKSIPPYTTSFLLTGILSTDYVDKTGDGITDDDLGTAVKFAYSRLGIYNWRAPYEYQMANYNEGFLSDHQDDKGSYMFGKKEVWYMDTIRTRTLVAVFYRSDRDDGLGVVDENGGPSTSLKLKKLDKIALYSRADLTKNGSNAVPIKVAHFEYDYSLFPGVPNNGNGGGKLTLKKVYFTFGNSSRGQSNPYVFSYDNVNLIGSGPWGASTYAGESNDSYTQRQTDRWGTYRQSYFTTPTHILFNSDFPYSIQPFGSDSYDARLLADKFASKWQLTGIVTPTGANITVDYESDDYSYVQDRKAMIMCPVIGMDQNGKTDGMTTAAKIYVRVPYAVDQSKFADTYLSGPNGQPWSNFSFKMMTKLNNANDTRNSTFEYVYGYAEIDYQSSFDVHGDIVGIPVKLISINNVNYNPVSVAAWQMIQTDLPQFAYPNYDNSSVDNLSGDVVSAVKSIIQDFANLRELFETFDQMAHAKGYADKIDPSRSMIRLNFPVGYGVQSGNISSNKVSYGKLGGGSRVHNVQISDNWGDMNSGNDAVTMNYGVTYDYTTQDDQGNTISSGVASYEPEIGNEENPFREPIPYTEKVQWSNDRYHYMEKPFGESYFPAPSVGYSQVKATAYGIAANETQPHKNTGWILSQFYTARDFPTQVDYLPMSEDTYEYDLTLLLFGAKYNNRVSTTQGFKVTLNDMHGKPKSSQTYDKNGQLISSTDYFYNVVDDNSQQKQLDNTVTAMEADGTISSDGALIATDVDVVSDLRESKMTSQGTSTDVNGGAFSAILVLPFGGAYFSETGSVTSYNSAALMKVIHQYGLVREVRTTQNGSTLTADNLLWDVQTGDVLLTRNQNEFGDYTYALHYPAFRAYDGMGSAYTNIGMVLTGFTSNADGTLDGNTLQTYGNYFSPGDELVDIDDGMEKRGWLLRSGDGSLRFIDQTGNFISGTANYMIIRSGRRNLLSEGAGTVVTMANPLVLGANGYSLQAGVSQRVLDAKAVTYKDEWGVPVPDFMSSSASTSTNQTPTKPSNKNYSSGCADYNINVVSGSSDCSIQEFSAAVNVTYANSVPIAQPTRGFLYFDVPPSAIQGPGVTINSVVLSLSGKTTTGINSAYIKRTTSPPLPSTGAGSVTWAQMPQTTETDKVLLGMSTNSAQNYPVDLTAMYTDWLATRGSLDGFSIALVLANETLPKARQMTFYGTGSSYTPTLTITYSQPGQCTDPVNQLLNPYYTGVKGDWRPNYNYVYQVTRNRTPGNASQAGGTNIRSNGYYNSYSPFWLPTVGSSSSPTTLTAIPAVSGSPGIVSDPRWVWSAQSVYYDQKGNEIENVDALKRYSAATFGYQQSLATAAASNARHNEIAFDGFEDYYFALQPDQGPCPLTNRQLDFGLTSTSGGQVCNGSNCVVAGTSHSGNYSLQLGGSLSITPGYTNADPPGQIMGFDVAGHAILLANEQAKGFAPIATAPPALDKDYIVSFWVYDGNPASRSVAGLQVKVNNTDQNVSTTQAAAAVVEGWKLLNFTVKKGNPFGVTITGGNNIYIDDLRVFPFDAEMKSFVYDDSSLRLMAQLDENNFAIFYEYDREGTPIRVKKETEKGVMTVKENRQSLITH